MIYIIKPLEILLHKVGNEPTVGELCQLLIQIHSDSSDMLKNLIRAINKGNNNKIIDITKVIKRAQKIAHREWIFRIDTYHFLTALAFEVNIKDKSAIDEYVKEESSFLPLEERFSYSGDIVATAFRRKVYSVDRMVDKIANSISINSTIIFKGQKGIGKKSAIMALIKKITLKQYPLLYNSIFLLNPNQQEVELSSRAYNGAFIISIMTNMSESNLFPRQTWESVNTNDKLKFIYILDSDNKVMENSLQNVYPHITDTIEMISPTREEIIEIMKTKLSSLTPYMNFNINDDVIEYLYEASDRFGGSSIQPTRAINMTLNCILHTINKNDYTVNIPDSLENSRSHDDILKLIENVSTADVLKKVTDPVEITIDIVEKFIISRYDVTKEVLASMMSTNIRESLKDLESNLNSKIFGQKNAISAVVHALWRRGLKLDPIQRPASFLFIGPTGTGKTYLTKCLANQLLGDENKMVRFDMSEYMEKHEVSKLIGSPPGYIGSSQPGRLTEEAKKNPHSIFLFDEIEKAHLDIMNIFLQILDDGRLTDNQGVTIDFSKAIIVMTSNIGTSEAYDKSRAIGYGHDNKKKDHKAIMKSSAEKHFKPEFINRIDQIIVYNDLEDEEFIKIIKTRLLEISENSMLNVNYEDIDKISKTILEKAKGDKYNIKKYNAREVKRVVLNELEDNFIKFIEQNSTFNIKVNIDLSLS